jgi:ankyrin repeat protein
MFADFIVDWLTRMWTYQEIKLAKMAVVLTKKGPISFSAICRHLQDKAVVEVGQEWEGDARGKYPSIAKTFRRLQRNDELGISLPDIAIGCAYRDAWDKLDYARAIFPTLNMEWKSFYSRDQAMRKVYSAQKRHASRLVLFHGPVRASYPGWAPSVFNDLKDCEINDPGIWKVRGLQHAWFSTKVKFIFEREADRFYLALESDYVAQCQSVAVISEQTLEHSPESIALFEKAVREGNGYLLTDKRLDARADRHWSIVGLLVERFTLADEQEAWVCLTVAIGQTEKYYKAERSDWLLLHENPTSRDPTNGKGASTVNYQLLHTVKPSSVRDLSEYPLHRAAQQDDEEWCRVLLAVENPDAVDSRGWTALQVAAASDSRKAAAVLIESGAAIESFNPSGNNALILAVDNVHVDMALLLCEAGSDVNACSKDEGFGSALVAAVRRNNLELVSLLLAFGADATGVDAAGWGALHSAVIGEDQDEQIVDALLEAGADPNIPSHGLLPLSLAAQTGNASLVAKLLRNEAHPEKKALPDPVINSGHAPLCYAIQSSSLATVVALLEGGASVDNAYRDGWTPMMIAAREGDHEVGKALKAKGAGLSKSGADGLTPLHIAALNGSRVFFKWLIAVGADANAKDSQGRTARDVVVGFEILS